MNLNKDESNATMNRLVILYALTRAGASMSREQLASVLLTNSGMSWFTFSLTVSELIEDGLIEEQEQRLSTTRKGHGIVQVYESSVDEPLRHKIDRYITKNRDELLQEIVIVARFEKSGASYKVELKLQETGTDLLSLTLDAPNREQAANICKKWKQDPQAIYASIITLLT